MPPEPPANPYVLAAAPVPGYAEAYVLAAAPVPGYAEAGLLANPYVLAAAPVPGYAEAYVLAAAPVPGYFEAAEPFKNPFKGWGKTVSNTIVYNKGGTRTINPSSLHAQERQNGVLKKGKAAVENDRSAESNARMLDRENKKTSRPRPNQGKKTRR